MSKIDLIDTEIARRQEASKQLQAAEADLLAAKEQFNKLDEMYREEEKNSRNALECKYKEAKYFTGKWPVVYQFGGTEYYPYFNGTVDNDCNPYYPISKIKNKTFDGLGPLYVSPTEQAGTWARDRNYSGTLEQPLRATAMAAIVAYPDISGEVGSCSNPADTNQATCTLNGGTWRYSPGVTATEKITAAITPWKNKIVEIMADLCDNSTHTEQTFWQNILDKLNTILAATVSNVLYPNHTPDFIANSPADLARDYLISNQSSIDSHVINRISYLQSEAAKEEKVFYSIIKLRFNQGNGSFSKTKNIDMQIKTNRALIKDSIDATASLNILKVKNS
jgi:hypothetical protein